MQSPHCLLVASEHRGREWRSAFGISCFEVGAELNQRVERTVVVPRSEETADQSVRRRDHVVESALLLFVLRKTPRKRISILLDEATKQIDISERDGGKHMMPGAAADQQIDDVSTGLRKDGGPSDDIHLVEVANAMHVRAGIKQHAHRFKRTASRREMKRQRIIAIVAHVRISAVLEQ